MSVMPDFTRLLALGLLNYADDHGYFWANPLMIRGALFPFEEDSTRIRRALAQLAAEGYLRIGKAPDGREAGHIVKFSVHQRVDKPAKSEIQPLISFQDDSSNVLGLFDDQSCLDRKGLEGIGKDVGKTEVARPAASLPDGEWIQSLESDPAYKGIAVSTEIAKCRVWCATNRKTCSRRRIVAWLNRVEKPLGYDSQHQFAGGFKPNVAVLVEPEPKGWREEFPDYVDRQKRWADIAPDSRAYICKKMAEG